MDKFYLTTAKVCSGIGVYLWGGFGKFMQALVVLVVIDFATGIYRAWETKTLASRVGQKGIAKKVLIFVVIALAVVIQRLLNDAIPLREITIVFYIVNEALSIIENTGKYLPIPDKLKSAIVQLKKANDLTEKNKKE